MEKQTDKQLEDEDMLLCCIWNEVTDTQDINEEQIKNNCLRNINVYKNKIRKEARQGMIKIEDVEKMIKTKLIITDCKILNENNFKELLEKGIDVNETSYNEGFIAGRISLRNQIKQSLKELGEKL